MNSSLNSFRGWGTVNTLSTVTDGDHFSGGPVIKALSVTNWCKTN